MARAFATRPFREEKEDPTEVGVEESECSATAAPETNRPSVSGRVVWPQNGPRKQNAHEGLSQVRVIVGCGGQI
jgi:hypothetical protein